MHRLTIISSSSAYALIEDDNGQAVLITVPVGRSQWECAEITFSGQTHTLEGDTVAYYDSLPVSYTRLPNHQLALAQWFSIFVLLYCFWLSWRRA